MATTSYNALSQWRGRIGGLIYKVVDGKQVVVPYSGASHDSRTEAQMRQRAKFVLAGMISKVVPHQVLVGMSGQRSQRRRMFVSNIVRHATTSVSTNAVTATLAATDLVFSQGAAAPVSVSNVSVTGGVVSGTVGNLPETVDAVMVIAVVYDTSLGIYTHMVYQVVDADDTSVSLDTSGASSGDIAHLYAVPVSLTDAGISYTRSADGAQRNESDGFTISMLMNANDGSCRYGRSQYLRQVSLGDNTPGGGNSGGNGGGNTPDNPGDGDDLGE